MATQQNVDTTTQWNDSQLQPFFLPGHLRVSDTVSGPGDKSGLLGHGSYGCTKKIKYNGIEFAAKIIHSSLIQQESYVVKNFIQECHLMSTLSHANIVQFVGLCHLPEESELPLLVMELMDHNLHCYLLDDCNSNLPLSLQQSILEDVAKGLNYLHTLSDPIIHRDLTATNVLLNSALVAKISDFGNSRLLPNNFNSKKLTTMPGTQLYMPPEANQDDYNTKLDIFSFGQLALFTLTQVFPEKLLDAAYKQKGMNQRAGRSEVERRMQYFNKLDSRLTPMNCNSGKIVRHPLVVLVRECLANEPAERPQAVEIVERLQQKEYSKDLTQMAKKLADKEGEVERLYTLLEQKNQELQDIKSNSLDVDSAFRGPECQKFQIPPIRMSSHPHAVVIGNKVYIGGGYARTKEESATILVFDSQDPSNPWDTLPICPTKYFGLATIDEKLAIVAGSDISGRTKTGHVYTWDPAQPTKKWEKFKSTSMLNYRSSISVVSYGKWLIAAGGEGRDGMPSPYVEKLDTTAEANKCHWTSCAKLATKSSHLSLSIVEDKIFAFCTNAKVPTSSIPMPSNVAFFASVGELLASNEETPQDKVWHEVEPLPIKSSTAVVFKGSLLALGGLQANSIQNVSSDIYRYSESDPSSSKWVNFGSLTYLVYQCASVELDNNLFVYGRNDEDGTCVYYIRCS